MVFQADGTACAKALGQGHAWGIRNSEEAHVAEAE